MQLHKMKMIKVPYHIQNELLKLSIESECNLQSVIDLQTLVFKLHHTLLYTIKSFIF